MKKVLIVSIFVFLTLTVTGCGTAFIAPTATPTLFPTNSPTPTATNSPTPTFTPTVTPTLQLPVLPLTPVPKINTQISANNAAQMQEVARYWGNPDTVSRVSADQTRLIVANVEGIYIYDTDTRELIKRLEYRIYLNHFAGFVPLLQNSDWLSVSEHGDWIAFLSDDLTVNVIDENGNKIFTLQLPPSGILDWEMTDFFIQISPLGKYLYYEYQNQRHIFDIDNSEEIDIPDLKNLKAREAKFSSNEKFFIIREASNVMDIFATKNWSVVAQITPQIPKIMDVDINANLIAFYGNDGSSIELWDYEKQELLKTLTIDRVRYYAGWDLSQLKLSNDGKYAILMQHHAAVYAHRTIVEVINLNTLNVQMIDSLSSEKPFIPQIDIIDVNAKGEIELYMYGIYQPSWASAGRAIPTSYNLHESIFHDPIRFSESTTSYSVALLNPPDTVVCQISFVEWDRTCRVKMASPWLGIEHTFANNEYFTYSYSDNKSVNLYTGTKVNDKRLLGIIPNVGKVDSFWISSLDYLPKLRKVALQSNYSTVYIYDLSQSRFIAQMDANWYAISTDENHIVGLNNSRTSDHLYVYEIGGEKPNLLVNKIYPKPNPSLYIYNGFASIYPPTLMNISPDSQFVVIVSSFEKNKTNGIRTIIVDINQPKNEIIYETLINYLPTNTAEFLDPGSRSKRFRETNSISAVAISPDNSMVVCGTLDGRFIVIDLKTGTLLSQLQAHYDQIMGVKFSPDGKYLVSLGRSGIMKIWGILP